MEPEARLLHYFLAVAEELNFTRAAARLHIAQPSLSAQIRQLESQLGVSLLRRSTHEVSLTDAGQALIEQGPEALAGLQRAWDAARHAGRGDVGTLRLAYPLSAGHDTAPRLVQALHEACPSITVTTDVLPSPQVLLAVRDHRADAGIARAPAPMAGVRLQRLRQDPMGVLVADDHPLARRRAVDLTHAAHYPVVVHPRAANPSHYDFVVGLFTAVGLHPNFVQRDIVFDLSQRVVSPGDTVTPVGRSAALALPSSVRWIPLAEKSAVPVMLVLPSDGCRPTAAQLGHIARNYAAGHGWLPETAARRANEPGSPSPAGP